MREKQVRIEVEPGSEVDDNARIQRDLERIGVSPAFSAPVAARLGVIADDLSPKEYRAVLEGVAAAYGVHREGHQRTVRDAVEMHRLLEDFGIELKKLDEGLRTLSSYLIRLRTRAGAEPTSLLH